MDLSRTARGHLLAIVRRDLAINARLAALVLEANPQLADARRRDHRGAVLEVERVQYDGSGYATLTAPAEAPIPWSVHMHVPTDCMKGIAPALLAKQEADAKERAKQDAEIAALHARFPIGWIERTVITIEIRDGSAVMSVVENADETYTMLRASWQDQESFEQYVSETTLGRCRMFVGPLSSFIGREYDCVVPDGMRPDTMIVDMTIASEVRLAA